MQGDQEQRLCGDELADRRRVQAQVRQGLRLSQHSIGRAEDQEAHVRLPVRRDYGVSFG